MRAIMWLALVSIVALAISCNDAHTPLPPETHAISDDRIEGVVHLYDEYANEVSDRSGVLVTATSTSGVEYTAQTDESGAYALEDLPAGNYSIVASHSDYSGLTTMANATIESVQYVGADVLTVVDLALGDDLASDLVVINQLNAFWTYEEDPHNPGLPSDSAFNAEVEITWKHDGAETWPMFYVATSADDDCSEALFVASGVNMTDENGSARTYVIGTLLDQIQRHYSGNPAGVTFYLQVRPYIRERTTVGGIPTVGCGEASSASFSL